MRLPIIGSGLAGIGAIGVFFGRLIQAAVSRQREFLADASSVQFTRNPAGLAGALQKIGQYGYGSRLESEHAPDLCHMFFGNGVREPFFGLLATHPPIPDRIHAIDPTWDGNFPPLDEKQIEVVKHAAVSELEHTPKPMPDYFQDRAGRRHHCLGQHARAAGHPVAFRPAESRQSHAVAFEIRRTVARFIA